MKRSPWRLSYLAMMVASMALAGEGNENETPQMAADAYSQLVTTYCRDPRRATREETIATHRAILAWCMGKTAGLCAIN
ncbi:MAG TPA: hypothetical protein VFE62_20860 [Gemmataceae bacterium]|nr:hypothetical protein [Gemmataceae bacterium]